MNARKGHPCLLALLAALLPACTKQDDAPLPPATTAPTASVSTAEPPAAPASSIPQPAKAGLQLLKFRFTSGVKNKEPEDELKEASPGDRVYAHFTLRNRGGEARKLRVVFRVDGKEKTTLNLNVDPSWSFRTWGFNTLRDGDAGKLSVTATDDTGVVVVEESIVIRGKKK